jgi:ligand-binding sensor domain-containing protein
MNKTALFLITVQLLLFAACSPETSREKQKAIYTEERTPTISVKHPTQTAVAVTKTLFPPIRITETTLNPADWDFYNSRDLIKTEFFDILQTIDGSMWFGGNFSILKFKNNQWTNFDKENNAYFKQGWLESIIAGPDGKIFALFKKGGIRSFDGVKWENYVFEDNTGDFDRKLFVKKSGEVCVFSFKEIACFNGSKWTYTVLPELQNSDFYCDLVLTDSGSIWIAAKNGSLLRLRDNQFKEFTPREKIIRLAKGRENSFWAIRKSGVIEKIDDQGRVLFNMKSWILKVTPPISLLETREGAVWIGGGFGFAFAQVKNKALFDRDGKEINSSLVDDSYPFKILYNIFQAKDGSLWLVTENGIFNYHKKGN